MFYNLDTSRIDFSTIEENNSFDLKVEPSLAQENGSTHNQSGGEQSTASILPPTIIKSLQNHSSINSNTSKQKERTSPVSNLKRPASMYERRISSNGLSGQGTSILAKNSSDARHTSSMYQCMANEMQKQQQQQLQSQAQQQQGQHSNSPGRSLSEEVNRRADAVTHCLKELIHAMQGSPVERESLVPCAEGIQGAVFDLIEVFTMPVSRKVNQISLF